MKIRKEFIIGLVVIAGGTLLWFGINYLKGINVFDSQRTYYAVYKNVGGLVESNPVTYQGSQVGIVSNVQLTENYKWVVTFSIVNDEFEFYDDAIAQIVSSDLFGSRAIEIDRGESGVWANIGDTLYSDVEKDLQEVISDEIKPIKQKADQLFADLDSLVRTVEGIFDEEIAGNFSESFKSIQRSLKTLEHTSIRLDSLVARNSHKLTRIFSNVESITNNMQKNNDMITNILTNMSAVSDSLAAANLLETINNANDAIASFQVVMEKVENGEGTLGMLINDDKLYNELAAAADELENLVDDIQAHPERYMHFSIFGKKNKGLRLSNSDMDEIEEVIDDYMQQNNGGND